MTTVCRIIIIVMKINRLFAIVYLLLDKKMMTAKELAGYFEVSTRTILRDICSLSVAGIPIFTSKGRGGGISILDTFRLDKTVLTAEEQSLIILALQGLAATNNKQVATLLPKLKALFNRSDIDWIEVDFSRWGHQQTDNKKFETIKQAILLHKAITCRYVNSYGESKKRKILPLKLVFRSKSWYLLGVDARTLNRRMYKLNRMLNELTIGDSFEGDNLLSVDNPKLHCPRSTKLITVSLRFDPGIVYRAYDEFDADYIIKNSDGTFNVTVTIPHDEWIYGFLLSLGSSVYVLGPKNVRQRLLFKAKEIELLYAKL